MAMTESDDEGRRKLPEGFLRPGRLTTTADPEMRRRAKRILREHREDDENEADDA